LYFFIDSSIFASKHTKITPVVSVMGLPPKNLYNKRFEICQFFRFGLHRYKLATLRATVGLIVTSCYSIKLVKIKGFFTSQKRLWPATLERLGRPDVGYRIFSVQEITKFAKFAISN